ncbi:MAG: AAA-like domain-containing protein [Ardenticatenaceae bacterium]
MSPFKAGGPLHYQGPAIYVERQADRDAWAYLQAMEYFMLIEPRQQGKTSLLTRLRAKCDPNTLFAYTSIEDLHYNNEQAWYADLWHELSPTLEFLQDKSLSTPTNHSQWRSCLRSFAQSAEKQSRQIVIALDEVGSMSNADWTDSFFATLRNLYNQRAFNPIYQRVTFILVGSFHPRDLIKDQYISPFNVAKRVRLLDFTLPQVRELVSKGGWSDEQASALAERIHYWTDGQPYLSQLICVYLEEDATPADVDASVLRLRREDENHLRPMFKRLHRDDKLRRYVSQIHSGQRIKFYPPENKIQSQLELLGVVKADAQGDCIIRNRIYEQALLAADTRQPALIIAGAQESAPKALTALSASEDKDQSAPTIAIITALPKEFAAMRAMLSNVQRSYVRGGYFIGQIPTENGGQHDVILALMADMGTNPAAILASRLRSHFPTIQDIIMVGIAGGVPHPEKPSEHVRLGDVVVSNRNGVVQYDFDKEGTSWVIHRHPPRPPSARLLLAVRLLEANELAGEFPWLEHIKQARKLRHAARPKEETDILSDSNNPTVIIPHPDDPYREPAQPRIFSGPIASANKLLKNPLKRDQLRDTFGVKAIEMEGSGIADATWNDSIGYLVVRGICDYCDHNKNDLWQGYAAVVAAAYTRALLESMPA